MVIREGSVILGLVLGVCCVLLRFRYVYVVLLCGEVAIFGV